MVLSEFYLPHKLQHALLSGASPWEWKVDKPF
jgi:hypothetical protein